MTPSVDSLTALLNGFDCAMVTIIDAEAHPHTRPMRALKAPFNGHLWFRLGEDAAPAEEIGRGAEVSAAYGGSAGGPYVTVYGRAIVLRNPASVRSVRQEAEGTTVSQRTADRLICICARAAEVWDTASSASPRTFAFANAHAMYEAQRLPQERAFAPRLVAISTMPCAS